MSGQKIVSVEPGMAHIFDRETGKKLGYVLQDNWNRWWPYRNGHKVGSGHASRKRAAEDLADPYFALHGESE